MPSFTSSLDNLTREAMDETHTPSLYLAGIHSHKAGPHLTKVKLGWGWGSPACGGWGTSDRGRSLGWYTLQVQAEPAGCIWGFPEVRMCRQVDRRQERPGWGRGRARHPDTSCPVCGGPRGSVAVGDEARAVTAKVTYVECRACVCVCSGGRGFPRLFTSACVPWAPATC